MGFFNSVFKKFKRNADESTVDYLGRVGDAVKDGNEDISRMDEAEVYFAYGRFEQGLEIIEEILKNDPINDKALEAKNKYSLISVNEGHGNTQNFQIPTKAIDKKRYLVSVIANVEGNTFPQNFEILSEHDVKNSKEGQDFLIEKINEQGYNSWGFLSVIELKD